MPPGKIDLSKWTYSSVRSRETVAQMDIRTPSPRSSIFISQTSRVLSAKRRGAQPGPRASAVGADGRFRSITEACRETDRSERSKVSQKSPIHSEITRSEKNIGDTHETTLALRLVYVDALREGEPSLSDLVEAEKIIEDVEAKSRRVSGSDHPFTRGAKAKLEKVRLEVSRAAERRRRAGR